MTKEVEYALEYPGGERSLVALEANPAKDKLKCSVRHPDAGGRCKRVAKIEVYGLLFCKVHGEEVQFAAISERKQDAAEFLSRLDNPDVPPPNPDVYMRIQSAVRELTEGASKAESRSDWALRRAYPFNPELVAAETTEFDYDLPAAERGNTPVDNFAEARRTVHKLMRIAYERGEDWAVEVLEERRQSIAAQLAYALQDYERRYGNPAER